MFLDIIDIIVIDIIDIFVDLEQDIYYNGLLFLNQSFCDTLKLVDCTIECPGLKPNWCLGIISFSKQKYITRLYIIFSKTLEIVGNRLIGR